MDTSIGSGAVASLPGALAPGLRVVSGGAQTAHAFAGKSKVHEGIFNELEVLESDCSKNREGHLAVEFETAGGRAEDAENSWFSCL